MFFFVTYLSATLCFKVPMVHSLQKRRVESSNHWCPKSDPDSWIFMPYDEFPKTNAITHEKIKAYTKIDINLSLSETHHLLWIAKQNRKKTAKTHAITNTKLFHFIYYTRNHPTYNSQACTCAYVPKLLASKRKNFTLFMFFRDI